MKLRRSVIFLSFITTLITIISSAQINSPSKVNNIDFSKITQEQIDHLGITDINHLSAASKRALMWPTDLGNDWFVEFSNLSPL